MLESSPTMRVFVTPISPHPRAPWFPISHPDDFAGEVADAARLATVRASDVLLRLDVGQLLLELGDPIADLAAIELQVALARALAGEGDRSAVELHREGEGARALVVRAGEFARAHRGGDGACDLAVGGDPMPAQPPLGDGAVFALARRDRLDGGQVACRHGAADP